MTKEGFCDRHGSYDRSLGRCPDCVREQGLSREPGPLDDELPTDPWGGQERPEDRPADAAGTDLHGGESPSWSEGDEITDAPLRPRPMWDDDGALTQPARRQRSEWDAHGEITDAPLGRYAARDEDGEATMLHRRTLRSGSEGDETVVMRAEPGLLGYLIVKEGVRRGQVRRVRHGTTVGSGDANIMVPDMKVSPLHASFTVHDDQFYVHDLGSASGTSVNGAQIQEATPLQENDVIKIGNLVCVLKTLT